MRFSSPIRLVLYMSAVILLIVAGVYLALYIVGLTIISWKFLIWYVPSTFLLLYLFLRSVMHNYLTEKFKLIYKTIQNLKLTKEEKRNTKIDMAGDVLTKVEQEVQDWAESKRS